MSDFQSPSEEELLYQLMAAQQGGADPYSAYLGVQDPFYSQNKKIDYLNKVGNLIGIPFTQLAGASAGEQAPPAVNTTRQVYSGNPAFQKAFDAIDAGYDPYSVTAAYVTDSQKDKTIAGIDPKEFRAIAEQYAQEQSKINTDVQASGGGWTMPDGSKSKQAPLGGNDIYATASEYDLMGAPSQDEALKLVAQSRAARHGAAKGRLASEPQTVSAGGALGGLALPSIGKPQAAARRWDEDQYNRFTKQDVSRRLGQARNTQIRSDANMNAMRRIVALKQLLGA